MQDQQKPESGRIVRATNVSLYPPQRAALEAIARREGHNTLATVVQRLIVEEAVEVFGENWAEIVTTDTDLRAA